MRLLPAAIGRQTDDYKATVSIRCIDETSSVQFLPEPSMYLFKKTNSLSCNFVNYLTNMSK